MHRNHEIQKVLDEAWVSMFTEDPELSKIAAAIPKSGFFHRVFKGGNVGALKEEAAESTRKLHELRGRTLPKGPGGEMTFNQKWNPLWYKSKARSHARRVKTHSGAIEGAEKAVEKSQAKVDVEKGRVLGSRLKAGGGLLAGGGALYAGKKAHDAGMFDRYLYGHGRGIPEQVAKSGR